jgi:hypothetical protein
MWRSTKKVAALKRSGTWKNVVAMSISVRLV